MAKGKVVPWNKDEINKILDSAKKSEKKEGARDYLIMLLATKTGMRVGEIFNLLPDDIEFDKRSITIRDPKDTRRKATKEKEGHRVDTVLIDTNTLELIRMWINTHRDKVYKNIWGKLSYRGMKAIPSKYQPICGVDKPISMHTFRHFYGTQLKKEGVEDYGVKTLMRHKKMSTTEIYLHPEQEDYRNDYEKVFGR